MESITSRLSLRTILLLLLIFGLFAISAACGSNGEVYPDEPSGQEELPAEEEELPAEEEEPMAEEEEASVGDFSNVELNVWLPAYSSESGFAIPEWVFHAFAEQTGVEILFTYYLPEDFFNMISTTIAAGDPPDVTVQVYNQLSVSMFREYMTPLDQSIIDTSRIYPDGLESMEFDGLLFGLPWLRSSCSTDYHYLASFQQFEDDENRHLATMALIDFVNQTDPWIENFEATLWFPTKIDTAENMGRLCQPVSAIRLDPFQVPETIEQVSVSVANLERITPDISYNPAGATAFILENGDTLLQLAPISHLDPSIYFPDVLAEEGAIVGALILLEESDDGYPPGDYAVYCYGRDRSDGECYLIPADGSGEYPVPPEVFEQLPAPVDRPLVALEEGSIRKCYRLDGIKICIKLF